MVALNTLLDQTSTQSVEGDNGEFVQMTVTYPTVTEATAQPSGGTALFRGDGRLNGSDPVTFRDDDSADDGTASAIPIVTVEFDSPVDGFSFDIFDIDEISAAWDDQIRVVAFDKDGNPVPITISSTDTDVEIEFDGTAADGFVAQVEGSADGAGNNITNNSVVTFTMDNVASVQIFYGDGDANDNAAGFVTFDLQELTDVYCFARGSEITAQSGAVKVEDLKIGQNVLTRDGGYMPVRWIGKSVLKCNEENRPIRFCEGAIGNDAAFSVSPNHKVLIAGWRAELIFGVDEALVAAKHLVNGDTIYSEPCETVTYYHVLLDSHELLLSNGVWTESFFPGPEALKCLSAAALAELEEVVPGLTTEPAHPNAPSPIVRSYEAQVVAGLF